MIPIPPQVLAAAAQLAGSIVGKAERAVIGIFDPGVKRDANRVARAQMWFEFAEGGSLTAARRLHGGSKVQYTAKERQYYIDRWAQFARDKPDLAQQALAAGDLGVPEPGSDATPPSLPDDVLQSLQAEMSAYSAATMTTPATSSTSSPSLATVASSAGTSPTMMVLFAVVAVVAIALAVVLAKRR